MSPSSLKVVSEVAIGDRGDTDDSSGVLELAHHISSLVRVQVGGEDELSAPHLIPIIPRNQSPASSCRNPKGGVSNYQGSRSSKCC